MTSNNTEGNIPGDNGVELKSVVATSEHENAEEKEMEIINNENLSGFLTLFGITQFFGIILVILVAYWSLAFQNGFGFTVDHVFTWHPFLMIIGMIYLQGSSILIYRGFRNAHKKSLKLAHASIHAVALVFVIFAGVAVFQSHNLSTPPKPNLYTIHSWVGSLASTFFLIQWLGSFITFLYPGLSSGVKITVMPYHVFLGLTIFVLASAAAVLGFGEYAIFNLGAAYQNLERDAVLINSMAIIVVIFAVLVVFLTTNINYKRYPRPEDRELLNRTSD